MGTEQNYRALGLWPLAAALSIALVGIGCSGEPTSSSKQGAVESPVANRDAPVPQAASPQTTGAITGAVHFVGEPPSARTIRMAADPYCAGAHAEGATSRAVVVGAEGGLGGVFVYVKSGLSGAFAAPKTPAVITQRGCQYSPKMVGVQTGQPLEISNGDSTLHNVHALPERNRGFNLAMPQAGMKSTKKFDQPEVLVRIKCDVHPWMEAFVGVVDHPFFAVTGSDGKFTIEGLPPGSYEIEAVHPKLGTRSERVTVSAEHAESVSFSFSRAK